MLLDKLRTNYADGSRPPELWPEVERAGPRTNPKLQSLPNHLNLNRLLAQQSLALVRFQAWIEQVYGFTMDSLRQLDYVSMKTRLAMWVSTRGNRFRLF